jgi:hypothetical protein
MREHDIPSS